MCNDIESVRQSIDALYQHHTDLVNSTIPPKSLAFEEVDQTTMQLETQWYLHMDSEWVDVEHPQPLLVKLIPLVKQTRVQNGDVY